MRANETGDVPCSPEVEAWGFFSVGHLSRARAQPQVDKNRPRLLWQMCGTWLGWSFGDCIM